MGCRTEILHTNYNTRWFSVTSGEFSFHKFFLLLKIRKMMLYRSKGPSKIYIYFIIWGFVVGGFFPPACETRSHTTCMTCEPVHKQPGFSSEADYTWSEWIVQNGRSRTLQVLEIFLVNQIRCQCSILIIKVVTPLVCWGCGHNLPPSFRPSHQESLFYGTLLPPWKVCSGKSRA